ASGALADTLDRFRARLLDISGESPATNPANAFSFPPKRIESLRWLGGALNDLHGMVDGADAAPSPDVRAGWARLQPLVEATLAAWRRLSTTGLEPLNDRVRAAGKPPLTLAPGSDPR